MKERDATSRLLMRFLDFFSNHSPRIDDAKRHDTNHMSAARTQPVFGLVEMLLDSFTIESADHVKTVKIESERGKTERDRDEERGPMFQQPAQTQTVGRRARFGKNQTRRQHLRDPDGERQQGRQDHRPGPENRAILLQQIQQVRPAPRPRQY